MANYSNSRRRRRPNDGAQSSPKRVEVSFDGYRTLELDTAALYQRLQAAFGDVRLDPNRLFSVACRVKGCLAMHCKERAGRLWVCLLYRNAEMNLTMIAIPTAMDAFPVVCVRGASENEAQQILNRFVAAV